MAREDFCDGCGFLDYSEPVNRNDVYAAHCLDPEKPAMGSRRTIAVMMTVKPVQIIRPVWCRGKRPK